MSTLWGFGDSYLALSSSNSKDSSQEHWIHLLKTHLNCDGVELRCHPGAANEWIYLQFLSVLPKIKPNDYIVFVSSQMNRRWFFEHDVGSSNFHINDTSMNAISSQENNALKQYAKYLANPLMASIFFENTCNSIHYQAIMNNLNLILLPGFESGADGFPINGRYKVEGSLFNIGVNEIKGKTIKLWQKYIGVTHAGRDPRVGHLSYENHVILSKKLSNTFLNNESLDLTAEFKEDFL